MTLACWRTVLLRFPVLFLVNLVLAGLATWSSGAAVARTGPPPSATAPAPAAQPAPARPAQPAPAQPAPAQPALAQPAAAQPAPAQPPAAAPLGQPLPVP